MSIVVFFHQIFNQINGGKLLSNVDGIRDVEEKVPTKSLLVYIPNIHFNPISILLMHHYSKSRAALEQPSNNDQADVIEDRLIKGKHLIEVYLTYYDFLIDRLIYVQSYTLFISSMRYLCYTVSLIAEYTNGVNALRSASSTRHFVL